VDRVEQATEALCEGTAAPASRRPEAGERRSPYPFSAVFSGLWWEPFATQGW
jgi:hypothetical protein